MKKRLLVLVLVMVMCLGLVAPAMAVEIVDSGKCGDNLTWTLDSEGTLTISGTGGMWDYITGSNWNYEPDDWAPWRTCGDNGMTNKISSVVIEEGVTSIGAYAFDSFYNMTDEGDYVQTYRLSKLVIPASLISIGEHALYGCSSLNEIQVNPRNPVYKSLDGVLYTADMSALIKYPAKKEGAFFTIPNGVAIIESHAFYYNENLTQVSVPDSVTSIGSAAFCRCTALTSINLPKYITSLPSSAFARCSSLREIRIPDSVSTIGESAFGACTGLSTIMIPASVTAIGGSAFGGCTSLSSITIPASVTVIGELAFADCTSLSTITIPASVTAIGHDPFVGCNSLTEITVDSANTQYFSKDGIVYSFLYNKRYKNYLISYPAGKRDTFFAIPEGTEGVDRFFSCDNLTHITFPRTMTTLWSHSVALCENLKSITIPDTVTLIGLGGPVFESCDNMSDIYYTGNKTQWDAIDKRPANVFEGLTIHYNSTGPDAQSAVSPSTSSFTDVSPDAYYVAPIAWAVGKEITSGTSATTFSPNQDCTNAQILTFLWRACGKPAPEIGNPFANDIPDAYLQAAIWAYEQDMVFGSTFDMNQPCTRAMAVTYIWQACGSPTAGDGNFIDVPDEADYAQAVAWAVENGVTSGTDNYVFSPNNVCSRGQIVTFLYRAMAGK